MNNHYKQCGVEPAKFIEHVLGRLEMKVTNEEAWHIGSFLKYSMRAGLKEGEPWEKDADKCADYIWRFRSGEWTR